MGLELAAVAGGEAIKAYQQKKAQDGVNGALRTGIAQQAAERAKANNLVTGDIGYLQASNPDAQRTALNTDFLNTLRANSDRADAANPTINGANSRYTDAVAAARGGADAHTATNANFIAALMAAARQRQAEGERVADTGTALGGIQQDANQDNFLTQLRMQKAATPNPWLTLAGGLATNLGTSGALTPKPTVPGYPGNPNSANAWETMPAFQ